MRCARATIAAGLPRLSPEVSRHEAGDGGAHLLRRGAAAEIGRQRRAIGDRLVHRPFDRLGGGSNIELNIQSRDMDAMLTAARAGLGMVGQYLPGAQARPVPGVDFAEPELRFLPDERRIAEAGWTRREMSTVMRALGDGVFVGDYFDGDRRMDIVLRAPEWTSPEQLASTPLATPSGGIQSVDQLVRMERTAGPNQVRRVDRRRARREARNDFGPPVRAGAARVTTARRHNGPIEMLSR